MRTARYQSHKRIIILVLIGYRCENALHIIPFFTNLHLICLHRDIRQAAFGSQQHHQPTNYISKTNNIDDNVDIGTSTLYAGPGRSLLSYGVLRASRRMSSSKHSSVLLLHVLLYRLTSQWSADRVVGDWRCCRYCWTYLCI